MQRAAILDLGTNTFHLLIVEREGDRVRELVRKRIYVKLALDGISHLSFDAMQRGLDALKALMKIVQDHRADVIRLVGTAALRTATNAEEYLDEIKSTIGINVEIINGEEEARLIFKGVSLIWNQPEKPTLIMDIGGGSVEFIIADKHHYLWSASYPLGVAILFKRFHRDDPIAAVERRQIFEFIDSQIGELKETLLKYPTTTLIGASGTFDVVGDLAGGFGNRPYFEVEVPLVRQVIQEITSMTYRERSIDQRIPASRVDMIVVALLLLEKILSLSAFTKVGISSYALKEGLASETI